MLERPLLSSIDDRRGPIVPSDALAEEADQAPVAQQIEFDKPAV